MEHVTINNDSYAVIQMLDDYPFGEVHEALHEQLLVRKKLVYDSENELQILSKMCEILSGLESEYLVKFMHAQQPKASMCYFYYEYVPLTIQKWILDLGQDVMEELQFELMNLANYLAQSGIKFRFDGRCVGLSKDIKIKYFLREFAIDNENKLVHYRENEARIIAYFEKIRQLELSEKSEGNRESLECKGSFAETRASWDVQSCRSTDSAGENKKESLALKLQETKKKSMQLLARLKGLKKKG